MKNIQIEGMKQYLLETGRLILSAGVSYLLTEGALGFVLDYYFKVQLDPMFKVQLMTVLTIVLKAVDRALHETGTEKGLLRF